MIKNLIKLKKPISQFQQSKVMNKRKMKIRSLKKIKLGLLKH